MVNQLLVISPSGPCFVHRSYSDEKELDPQLISAVVAMGFSGGVNLAEIKRILNNETENGKKLNIQMSKTNHYISCAISSENLDQKHWQEFLPKINRLTYETLGNPKDMVSLEHSKIDKMEDRIDIMMLKEGFLQSI